MRVADAVEEDDNRIEARAEIDVSLSDLQHKLSQRHTGLLLRNFVNQIRSFDRVLPHLSEIGFELSESHNGR